MSEVWEKRQMSLKKGKTDIYLKPWQSLEWWAGRWSWLFWAGRPLDCCVAKNSSDKWGEHSGDTVRDRWSETLEHTLKWPVKVRHFSLKCVWMIFLFCCQTLWCFNWVWVTDSSCRTINLYPNHAGKADWVYCFIYFFIYHLYEIILSLVAVKLWIQWQLCSVLLIAGFHQKLVCFQRDHFFFYQ